MEYYLPRELVLIGCGKRMDSVQPEKNSINSISITGDYIKYLVEPTVHTKTYMFRYFY